MEIYRITAHKPTVNDYITDILNDANVDARISRSIMSMRILADCGGRLVRYNTTDTFKAFAVAWFESHNANITKAIDLLTLQYSILEEYAETKSENIDREHITNGTDTKARDVATSSNDSSTLNATNADIRTDNATDEHLVSAENESGVQIRNRDTHNETIGDNATRSETESATGSERIDEDVTNTTRSTTTHDDDILTTVSGHKTAPAELIRAELENAKLNIYDEVIADFADAMLLNVF